MDTHPDVVKNPNVKGRDDLGRAIRTMEQRQKDHEAANLRLKGRTFVEIGEHFGLSDSTAFDMVARAWKDIPIESTEQLLANETAKLDYLEAKAHEIMTKHHAYVTPSGKVATLDGEILTDDGPALQAMNTLLKIADRRAKLLGLNAPTRTELTGKNGAAIEIETKSDEARASVLSLLSRLREAG